MAGCLRAVSFTSIIGQSAYSYSAMTGDITLIGASSTPYSVQYGQVLLDASEYTLGASAITFNFTVSTAVNVTIIFN